ncbi:unnamed protein product, partial [Phaeothamnion confervicola]
MALLSGTVDDIFACRAFGVATPLGLALRAVNRGVCLSYELLPPLLEGGDGDNGGEDGGAVKAVEAGAAGVPAPLQGPHQPQWPAGALPLPEALPPPALDFGGVPLMGRKVLRLCVRNFSAVPAPFAAGVRKHPAAVAPRRLLAASVGDNAFRQISLDPRALIKYYDDPSEAAATAELVGAGGSATVGSGSVAFLGGCIAGDGSRGGIVGGGGSKGSGNSSVPRGDASSSALDSNRSRPQDTSSFYQPCAGRSKRCGGTRLLDDIHEATDVFRSSDGREHTRRQWRRREDMFALRDGLGAAFLVEPARGVVPPWGVAVLTVTAFNEMPGRYLEEL